VTLGTGLPIIVENKPLDKNTHNIPKTRESSYKLGERSFQDVVER